MLSFFLHFSIQYCDTHLECFTEDRCYQRCCGFAWQKVWPECDAWRDKRCSRDTMNGPWHLERWHLWHRKPSGLCRIEKSRGHTPQIWETLISTYRNNCGVSRLSQGRLAGCLVRTWLTEACSIVCYDSAHPTYLTTIFVHWDVAQIWVVGAERQNAGHKADTVRAISAGISVMWSLRDPGLSLMSHYPVIRVRAITHIRDHNKK